MSSPEIKQELFIKFGSEYGPEEERAVLGDKDARATLERIVRHYGEARGFTPYVFEGSSPGADRFGVMMVDRSP